MPRRICDSCGKDKNIQGGKTCKKGHFICKECSYTWGFLGPSARTSCPLDGTALR